MIEQNVDLRVVNMIEKRLRKLGIFGIISLLSYTAMVVFSPFAYPGYDNRPDWYIFVAESSIWTI